MLLAPLQQLALEVHFLIGKLVDVDEPVQYLVCYEALATGESPVEIDGADECFEGVACKVAVVCLVMFVAADKLIETYLNRQSAERLPLHNLASGVGEEAFALAGEMMVNCFANDSVEYRIAKELKPLVVERRAALGLCMHRLVH